MPLLSFVVHRSSFVVEDRTDETTSDKRRTRGGKPREALHATRSDAYGCSRQGLTRFTSFLWVGPLPDSPRGSPGEAERRAVAPSLPSSCTTALPGGITPPAGAGSPSRFSRVWLPGGHRDALHPRPQRVAG